MMTSQIYGNTHNTKHKNLESETVFFSWNKGIHSLYINSFNMTKKKQNKNQAEVTFMRRVTKYGKYHHMLLHKQKPPNGKTHIQTQVQEQKQFKIIITQVTFTHPIKPFQPLVEFHMESSRLLRSAKK